jgi:hypothetical protein
MQRPEDPSGSPITEDRTNNEPLVPLIAAGHLCGFTRFPGSAGKPRFGRSPYRLKRRSILRAILLVVVVARG